MKTLFERLLDYYQISEQDYQYLIRDVSYDDLPTPDHFKDMDKAVDLVKSHLKNNDKIVVYGDYDADGITGCSILVKAFQYLNFNVGYYIPSRYIDGYGITLEKAKQFVEKGYRLVITVDNGISAFEPIQFLRDNNVDVLVLDHHDRQEKLPKANVIIHPDVSEYADETSSGAFTAFMFSSALLNRYDKYLATLAAISLISDMMPLRSFNRDLLRIVTKNYKKGEFLAIDYLLDGEDFNDTSIGLVIAPKINAVGRVDKSTNINRLVRYFTTEDKEEILSYRDWIYSLNNLRKQKSRDAKENIINSIKDVKEKALLIECEVEEGLLGLVANALMNQLGIPVIVFTEDSANPELLKGSARSVKGFDLAKAFSQLSKYEVSFGGHELAAGLSIKKEDFKEYKDEFLKLINEINPEKKEGKTIDLFINEINKESYELVRSFSPFGEVWPAPLFKLKRVKADSMMYSKGQDNIITTIGLNSRIIGFGYTKEQMSEYTFIDMVGNLRTSEYRGNVYYEFLIKDLEESDK